LVLSRRQIEGVGRRPLLAEFVFLPVVLLAIMGALLIVLPVLDELFGEVVDFTPEGQVDEEVVVLPGLPEIFVESGGVVEYGPTDEGARRNEPVVSGEDGGEGRLGMRIGEKVHAEAGRHHPHGRVPRSYSSSCGPEGVTPVVNLGRSANDDPNLGMSLQISRETIKGARKQNIIGVQEENILAVGARFRSPPIAGRRYAVILLPEKVRMHVLVV
jgi:hypothetical protein